MQPKRPTVNDLNTLGVQFYRSEAYDLAILQFEEALRLLPESAAIHFNLGGAYYGKQRLADAEREFRRALELDPSYVRAHWFRGLCLERLEHFREALAEFEWVLAHSVGTREARSAREEIQIIGASLRPDDGGKVRRGAP